MTTSGTITAEKARRLAGFLAHERETIGACNVAFMYEIARGDIAKGEGWGTATGMAMICEIIDDCSDWADENHLITRNRVVERRVGINYTGGGGDHWATDPVW